MTASDEDATRERPTSLGRVLPGGLRLEELIGGHVYRASSDSHPRELAVRLVAPPSPELASALETRLQLAQRVRHPALASIHAFGPLADDGYYIATELVQGQSLVDWACRSGVITGARSVALVHEICAALEVAHGRGIAHDALHPYNVQLCETADNAAPVKLLDLELPAMLHEHWHDLTRLRFLAPEQLQALTRAAPTSAWRCDAAMNIYSCGCLLYYLLTGETPYDGTSLGELSAAQHHARVIPPRQLNPEVSQRLDALVLRALAPDPSERFASLAELTDALGALQSEPVSPQPLQRAPEASSSHSSGPATPPIGVYSSSPPDVTRPSSSPPAPSFVPPPLAGKPGGGRPRRPWLPLAAAAAACLMALVAFRVLLGPRDPHAPASRAALSLEQTLPAQQDAEAATARGAIQPAPRNDDTQVSPGPIEPVALPLTARVRIANVRVQGSLPGTLVRRAVDRLQSQFKSCYEDAAQGAGHNAFGTLTVDLKIDQRGRALSPQVRGGELPGLDACVAERITAFVSEAPTDRRTAAASWTLAFVP